MIDQQRRYYRDGLIYGLKKQFPVKVLLDPVRIDIVTAGYPSRGPDSAPVTIVEFSDFECPFCGGLYPTLKTIEKNYADRVRLVYRQFPLTSMHPHAQKAAEASLCANDQKHFWDFHDSMFGDQQHLTVDDLKKRAVDLKLNTGAFNTCLDSGAKVDAVKKDVDEGHAAGVSGTPAMFIDGRFYSGNLPYADIREVIEDELQRQLQVKQGGK
jgi:protein-disulfide isomerase